MPKYFDRKPIFFSKMFENWTAFVEHLKGLPSTTPPKSPNWNTLMDLATKNNSFGVTDPNRISIKLFYDTLRNTPIHIYAYNKEGQFRDALIGVLVRDLERFQDDLIQIKMEIMNNHQKSLEHIEETMNAASLHEINQGMVKPSVDASYQIDVRLQELAIINKRHFATIGHLVENRVRYWRSFVKLFEQDSELRLSISQKIYKQSSVPPRKRKLEDVPPIVEQHKKPKIEPTQSQQSTQPPATSSMILIMDDDD